ncbi:YbhB/YbcL family Raf kinase inhibitor-like protein [Leifsonia sp. fls2-241-R2A-40a]|uniref:YbhB/YbcL family Raf kinase inhibitor-like protein n=1 Tax=Leifsonia sp. fls2-241-R2A-40a TaxID=3040290 RepID=UPI002549FED6|nr:YbhB/YbcL family Raf kinase inhibitor-like protein [Leifsonia sp. fls2-241-R2A-40a]
MANDPLERFRSVPSFTVSSNDFTDGAAFSREQWATTSGGGGISPHLSWSGFPAETKSFAVTIHDPDAPTGSGFWHWAVFNIPASVTELAADAGAEGGANLPEGAEMLSNELRSKSFTGAEPPAGTGTHRYDIVVHALDVDHLDIDPQSTPAVLGFNAHFHVLARGVTSAVATSGDI